MASFGANDGTFVWDAIRRRFLRAGILQLFSLPKAAAAAAALELPILSRPFLGPTRMPESSRDTELYHVLCLGVTVHMLTVTCARPPAGPDDQDRDVTVTVVGHWHPGLRLRVD